MTPSSDKTRPEGEGEELDRGFIATQMLTVSDHWMETQQHIEQGRWAAAQESLANLERGVSRLMDELQRLKASEMTERKSK